MVGPGTFPCPFVLLFRTANGFLYVESERVPVPEESVEARPEEHSEPGAFLVPVATVAPIYIC